MHVVAAQRGESPNGILLRTAALTKNPPHPCTSGTHSPTHTHTHGKQRLSYHPAAAGCRFRLLRLALQYVGLWARSPQHVTGGGEGMPRMPAQHGLLVERVLRAALMWFSAPVTWYGRWSAQRAQQEADSVGAFAGEAAAVRCWPAASGNAGGGGPGQPVRGTHPVWGEGAAASNSERCALLQLLLGVEMDRLSVWAAPRDSPPVSAPLPRPDAWAGHTRTAWDVSPRIALGLTVRGGQGEAWDVEKGWRLWRGGAGNNAFSAAAAWPSFCVSPHTACICLLLELVSQRRSFSPAMFALVPCRRGSRRCPPSRRSSKCCCCSTRISPGCRCALFLCQDACRALRLRTFAGGHPRWWPGKVHNCCHPQAPGVATRCLPGARASPAKVPKDLLHALNNLPYALCCVVHRPQEIPEAAIYLASASLGGMQPQQRRWHKASGSGEAPAPQLRYLSVWAPLPLLQALSLISGPAGSNLMVSWDAGAAGAGASGAHFRGVGGVAGSARCCLLLVSVARPLLGLVSGMSCTSSQPPAPAHRDHPPPSRRHGQC